MEVKELKAKHKTDFFADKARDYLHFCTTKWNESSAQIPHNLRRYHQFSKWRNERRCRKLLKKTQHIGLNRPAEKDGAAGGNEQRHSYAAFFESVLGFTPSETQILLRKDCGSATTDFIRRVKRFDPQMQPKEIYQACRNVWMLNAIQLLLEVKVEITPAVFAYSLLYPYTDNFLDDPNVTNRAKSLFFKSLLNRLMGMKCPSNNETESKIFRLIKMIENQYPRDEYPEVYKSMIEIHHAQQKSVRLLNASKKLTKREVLELVFHKGGTSVLADGYLANGQLSNEQGLGCYVLGVLLQLLDDWQDVKEDKDANLKTVFSDVENETVLAELLNKTLNLTTNLTKDHDYFNGENSSDVMQLIRKSCQFYMLNTVSKHSELFYAEYQHRMRKFLPFEMVNNNSKRKELIYSYISRC